MFELFNTVFPMGTFQKFTQLIIVFKVLEYHSDVDAKRCVVPRVDAVVSVLLIVQEF